MNRLRLARARRLLAVACAATALGAQAAGLGHLEAQSLARENAPARRAPQAALAGARRALVAADALPDPRLALGVESVPIQGPDRGSLTRDSGTEQRVSLMQEVPNRAKREARIAAGQARVERERALLAATARLVRRDASLAWLALHHAERRAALVADFGRENRLLQDTLGARIAAGSAMPAELTMARQDALGIADRADELAREAAAARAELRRWVGDRGGEPLVGAPLLPTIDAEALRARIATSAPELLALAPMRDMAAAEAAEADAERRGDWAWQLTYARRPRYDDMVSLMLSFDLPWQRERRQQPLADAKRREVERLDAEREDMARRVLAETDAMLAELRTLDAMHARQVGAGQQLADERVALTTASYQAGRTGLGEVLAARGQALDTRMKLIELEARRAALRVRLAALADTE